MPTDHVKTDRWVDPRPTGPLNTHMLQIPCRLILRKIHKDETTTGRYIYSFDEECMTSPNKERDLMQTDLMAPPISPSDSSK